MQILKKNEFKTVRLHTCDERWLVEKTFTAFSSEQQRNNAQYLYDALVWFHEEFLPIIRVPEPVKVDLINNSVYMTYLDDLPKAAHISAGTLTKTKRFFERCYEIRGDHGFLRDMQGSVVVTPLVQTLLDNNFPLRLGFKGDLRENLVIGSQGVILADIDSIALEPLGLSEVALYAELACSFSPQILFAGLFYRLPVPVAYQHLDEKHARQLNTAAVELIAMTMRALPPSVRTFKLRRAASVLARLVKRCYAHAK